MQNAANAQQAGPQEGPQQGGSSSNDEPVTDVDFEEVK